MNNFMSPASEKESGKKVPRHLESLTTTVFQSLFPPISPQTTPLSSIRRVLLLNREPCMDEDDASYTINIRHYAITTKAVGLSRPLRRLNAAEKLLQSKKARKGGLPNLGKLEDIADYMIGEDGAGYMTDATSGSEIETDAEVEVVETRAKKLSSKRQREKPRDRKKGEAYNNGVEKRAVKLVELGPRLRLRMTKVEEGICGGKVMWHEYVTKSREEERELDEVWEKRRREKEERRRLQRENVERKKQAGGEGSKKDEEEDDDEMDVDEWDSEGLEGDVELELNEEMEDRGEWQEEKEEIAAG